jgi:hypothetical protein
VPNMCFTYSKFKVRIQSKIILGWVVLYQYRSYPQGNGGLVRRYLDAREATQVVYE